MAIKLAWRNIWRNRRRTLITAFSIAFGLTLAVFFLCLGDGIYFQMTNDAVRMQAGHITLEHPEYRDAPSIDLYVNNASSLAARLSDLPEVERVKPLVMGQGVARSGAGAVGVAVIGANPADEKGSSMLAEKIVDGSYLESSSEPMVVIGVDMADRLNVQVGKKMVLSGNDVNGDLVEELCRVKGIFKTGSTEIDGFFMEAPIDFLRKLYGLPENGATMVGILLNNPAKQKAMMARIEEMMRGENVTVLPWQKTLPELASYIKMDHASNIVFQGILLFLIMFTIFNTILMSVLERNKEFAVLMALGTEPRLVKGQVLMESAFIALIGCAVGLLIGGGLAWWAQTTGIDLSKIYKHGMEISGTAVSPLIHARVSAAVLSWCGGVMFFATLLMSLLPMRKIADAPISDIMR